MAIRIFRLIQAFLAGLALAITPPRPPADPCPALDPFPATWIGTYTASIGGVRVAAAVHDTRTGCTWRFGSTEPFPTASTVKAQILAAVLLQAQDAGRSTLDPVTFEQASAMIRASDNIAASELYHQVGYAVSLQEYGRRLGLIDTVNVGDDWGGDRTTPDDQLHLLGTLLDGGGVLDAPLVDVARRLMGSVQRSQAWGVSAGAPTDSTVWLKNGWLYNDGSVWGPTGVWRVNSIGAVTTSGGHRWLLAVYGNEWPTMRAGVAGIETIARHVANVLEPTGDSE